jgi:hypothetical protein
VKAGRQLARTGAAEGEGGFEDLHGRNHRLVGIITAVANQDWLIALDAQVSDQARIENVLHVYRQIQSGLPSC